MIPAAVLVARAIGRLEWRAPICIILGVLSTAPYIVGKWYRRRWPSLLDVFFE